MVVLEIISMKAASISNIYTFHHIFTQGVTEEKPPQRIFSYRKQSNEHEIYNIFADSNHCRRPPSENLETE
jgi:hypothetical protein